MKTIAELIAAIDRHRAPGATARQGCTKAEIDWLVRFSPIPLNTDYLNFMRAAGHGCGRVISENLVYEFQYLEGMNRVAWELPSMQPNTFTFLKNVNISHYYFKYDAATKTETLWAYVDEHLPLKDSFLTFIMAVFEWKW